MRHTSGKQSPPVQGKHKSRELEQSRRQEVNRRFEPRHSQYNPDDMKPKIGTIIVLLMLAGAGAYSIYQTVEPALDSDRSKAPGYPAGGTTNSSLYNHLYPVLDEKGQFSQASITRLLDQVGSTGTWPKGLLIDKVNKWIGGADPITPQTTDFSHIKHRGSTDMWTDAGDFNSTRWSELVTFVETTRPEGKKDRIDLATWDKFAGQVTLEKGSQPRAKKSGCLFFQLAESTGAENWLEGKAGSGARAEIMNDLGEMDPETSEVSMPLHILKEFYTNSTAAYERATERLQAKAASSEGPR